MEVSGRRRHHRRLRARLGQSGKHQAQLGYGGALRDSEINGYTAKLRRVAEIRDRKPCGVRARRPSRDGKDHGERQGRRGPCRSPAPAASRSPPPTRRICRRKPRKGRRDPRHCEERSDESNPVACLASDCFAEPVIGRRFAPTRWLAMTALPSPRIAFFLHRPALPRPCWRDNLCFQQCRAARRIRVRHQPELFAMSMQSVASPAAASSARRNARRLPTIPGDEGWPVIGRTLAVLADPKGRSRADGR